MRTRTNGALLQTFGVDGLNQITNITRTGTFTASGVTPAPAASVTINGQSAQTNGDFTFARDNFTLNNGNNTFTTIAESAYGLKVTNTLTVNLPTTVALQYDANGNLITDGLRSFAYDAENQLTNIYIPSQWKSEFVHDGFGRRRISRDYAWQGGQWVRTNETRYLYDHMVVLQERDSNNIPLVTYTRGLDLSGFRQGAGGIGGLLARSDSQLPTLNSQHSYYHSDASGNVTALMDARQNITARYLYDPFGKPLGKWGPMAAANRYQFSSKELHPNSGTYYYGYRSYEPNLQRWLNRDPIQEEGGINFYQFNLNNPLSYSDANGLYARIKVDGNDVEIQIPLTYRGEGATPENIKRFDQAIEKTWTGDFGKYHVKTKVVKPSKDCPRDQRNIIDVPRKVPEKQRAFTNWPSRNSGVWPAKTTDWSAGHEAAHLMGLDDHYNYKNFKPDPDFPNNILSTYGGVPNEDNIQGIIDAPGNGEIEE